MIAKKRIPQGEFVMEYKRSRVYPTSKRAEAEEEYRTNDEACMILDAETKDGWYCLDATRAFNTVGRLLNHSPLRPMKALLITKKGVTKWRVGFLSTRPIEIGDELTWDCGCQPHGEDWLRRCPESSKVHCKYSLLLALIV